MCACVHVQVQLQDVHTDEYTHKRLDVGVTHEHAFMVELY